MSKITVSQQEFLRLGKTDPARAHQAFARGINLHLSPSQIKAMADLFDEVVDEEGNVSADALGAAAATGILVGVVSLALTAFGAGFAVGYAIGEIGDEDGSTTVTVNESGDGDVNVNINGEGNGEENGGG